MENDRLKTIIEALLIVSEDGLTKEDIVKVIEEVSIKEVAECIELLKEDYADVARAFTISEIAGKCRIVTKPEHIDWISSLYKIEPDRLTGPSLETLAIIAYKQPATRAEIEAIRGVSSGGVLKTLLDKALLKIKGRKDAIGKPLLYGTTDKFLELFGLNSLEDLPMLRDFKSEDLDFTQKQEIIVENKPDGVKKEEDPEGVDQVSDGEQVDEENEIMNEQQVATNDGGDDEEEKTN